jgi:hypothetical protein
MLARDKHSSLLQKFITYSCKEFFNIGHKTFWSKFTSPAALFASLVLLMAAAKDGY